MILGYYMKPPRQSSRTKLVELSQGSFSNSQSWVYGLDNLTLLISVYPLLVSRCLQSAFTTNFFLFPQTRQMGTLPSRHATRRVLWYFRDKLDDFVALSALLHVHETFRRSKEAEIIVSWLSTSYHVKNLRNFEPLVHHAPVMTPATRGFLDHLPQ